MSYFTIKKYIGWLVASSLVYFQFLIQTSSSILQNSWATYFNLSPLNISYLSAAFFYTYLFFQVPIGVIYDRYDAKKVLALSSFGLGLSCLLFASTSHYSFALVARMLMGGCAAFGFIGMLKVTANYFPNKQFSLMMGISESVAALTTMFGVIILAWAINHTSWQGLMVYFAVIIFMVTALVLIFINSETKTIERFNILILLKSIFSAITHPVVLINGLYGFFMAAVVNAFTSLWGIAFFTHTYAFPQELSAKIMTVVFLGLAVGCPLNGLLSKKYGNEREAMAICALICALCMSLIIYIHLPIAMLYILFFIVGVMCAVYVQSFAIVGQTVPQQILATSMAVTNMLIMASAPILQIVIGALLESNALGLGHTEQQTFKYSLSILPIGMFIAFLLCFLIKNNPEK